MNKDEKNLLDELWQAAGMGDAPKESPAAPEIKEETPDSEAQAPAEQEASAEIPLQEEESSKKEKKNTKREKQAAKKQAKAQAKQQKKEQRAAKKQAKQEKKEEPLPKAEETKEKKKNIKFLVLYTVIFVIVISGLIGGSYLVSTRIHKEMAQGNNSISNESTLKNIQIQNKELKEANEALEAQNAQLAQQAKDAEGLLESVGDMVEHDQYLAAAQNAYINQKNDTAKSIFRSIEKDKLSEPNKAYYDTLKEKLGL